MSQKIKSKKRTPRTHPCKPRGVSSKGQRVGAQKAPQSEVQKALLGKGRVQGMRPVEGRDYRDTWGKAYSRIQFFILSDEDMAA